MALLAQGIGIHREGVTVQRRMKLIRRGALLHMATNALIRDEKRVRRRIILRRSGCQLADIAQKNIVLRRVMWRAAGAGVGRATMVVALAADVNGGIILAGKAGRCGNVVIIRRERRIEQLRRVRARLVGIVTGCATDRDVGITVRERLTL